MLLPVIFNGHGHLLCELNARRNPCRTLGTTLALRSHFLHSASGRCKPRCIPCPRHALPLLLTPTDRVGGLGWNRRMPIWKGGTPPSQKIGNFSC